MRQDSASRETTNLSRKALEQLKQRLRRAPERERRPVLFNCAPWSGSLERLGSALLFLFPRPKGGSMQSHFPVALRLSNCNRPVLLAVAVSIVIVSNYGRAESGEPLKKGGPAAKFGKDKLPSQMGIKDVSPRSVAETKKLEGIRVSGEVVVTSINPDADRDGWFNIVAVDRTETIGGAYMRTERGGWIRVLVVVQVSEKVAVAILKGDSMSLAGTVKSTRFQGGISLINGDRGRDRIVTLVLENVKTGAVTRPLVEP